MTEPDAVEIRILGCLIEKQRTTPDVYPLSVNSLRLACNQSTNREPVVNYKEAEVVEGLRRLALRGWTRLASGAGSRVRKYRHMLDQALDLDPAELSLVAVLMLRGTQTPGELKQRCQRLHDFPDLASVNGSLERLVERGHVSRHQRHPGQKEDRYEQLMGALPTDPPLGEVAGSATRSPLPDGEASANLRLERLEAEIAHLRSELAALRAALGED